MFVGAPLALAADPLGRPWLFYIGLALLVIGLIHPVHPEETLGEKLKNIVRHLPGRRWARPGREAGDDDSV